MRNERGAVLGIMIILAFVFGVAMYADLAIAISQARQSQFLKVRPNARYAAEAGVVLARERLWRTPAYCGSTERVDSNANGALDATDLMVQITVTNCGAGNDHEVSAKVLY